MSADARLSAALPGHPKTKKLIRRCGEAGAWHLVCLILWARVNRPDGDLSGMTAEDIELAVDWRGDPDAFVSALDQVGFLDGQEGEYRLHDWAEHQPWSAGSEARSEKARWAGLCKQHGRAEAARLMPDYAARISAAGTEKSAASTPKTATSTDVAELDSATGTKQAAPSPLPSPSPYPSLLQEQEQDQEPPIPPDGGQADPESTPAKPKRRSDGLTYAAFMEACRADGEKPIPPSHAVFTFAADTGIPVEFVRLAWREFSRQYRDTKKIQAGKAGWRKKFDNCVRRNWYKLWWDSADGIALTTTGQLLKRELEAETARREDKAA